MRVLVCDQESEMLETIARSFEVDIATSKATCIDLMRANPVDVLVASERLSDGSGLELLSHVATRWPDTLRVLVIDPQRLKLLRGKLAPFRLHATLRYPVDDDEFEAVLNKLGRLLAESHAASPEPEPEPVPQRAAPAPLAKPAPTPASKVQKAPTIQTPTRNSSPAASAKAAATKKGANPPPVGSKPAPPPLKRRLGNYTPLGAPEDAQLRIVEREFDQTVAPLAARAMRSREEASRPKTPTEKAKTIAGQLSSTLKRLLKK